ncbi:MAG: GxxExxY protein [Verrucomicrobiia bacterium]
MAHSEITQEVIGGAFEVHRQLGYGFLERVYQRALQVELERRGLKSVTEAKVQVNYKGVVVGDYAADLLVADCVVVELKVAADYNPLDEAQLLNELKASGIKVGLLLNFGRSKVEFKRMVF